MREVNPYFAVIAITVISVFSGADIFYSASDFPVCENFSSGGSYSENSENNIHNSCAESENFFETAFSFQSKEADVSDRDVAAGIIPHHLLAADMIAEFFKNLEGEKYDTVVLIGPNHPNTGAAEMISSSYDWSTPYGVLRNDGDFLAALSETEEIGAEEDVISAEHSITSELAFIKRTFPDAEILPIILKSFVHSQEAENLARSLYEISERQNKKILVIASVDFSHYKNSIQAQADDAKSIAAIENYRFEEIYDSALDSPPSIFAVMKFGEYADKEFSLLNNSNSALLSGKPELASTTSYVTGYFADK